MLVHPFAQAAVFIVPLGMPKLLQCWGNGGLHVCTAVAAWLPKLQLLKIYCISVSLLTFCYPRFSHSLFFNITSFNSETDNIAFEGDAVPVNGTIELSSVNYPWRVGHLMYDQPVRLWDSTQGLLTDFRTRFSFTIDYKKSSRYSDGIAFYMAHIGRSIPPNSAGGYLGLFNTSNNENVSENSIVLVEFDTFSNADFDPPDVDRHVGINQNSLSSRAYTNFDIEGNEGKQGHVLITYNATTKYLLVYWSFNKSLTELLPSSANLSLKINLMEILPEWIKIGFSASTGPNPQRQVIHSWEFSSTLNSTDSNTSRSGERKRQYNSCQSQPITTTLRSVGR
ncbi:hypothetical protein L6164_037274 [Bauhinia variegata]|uniref:Uncharacterized protein n=1 Tax=Bauhinia variegata TaxID=167791 RepID=A0ACB9KJT7_BAUVA|nr:hypothetical protein L6164_037274 [Bauhinia variegata]